MLAATTNPARSRNNEVSNDFVVTYRSRTWFSCASSMMRWPEPGYSRSYSAINPGGGIGALYSGAYELVDPIERRGIASVIEVPTKRYARAVRVRFRSRAVRAASRSRSLPDNVIVPAPLMIAPFILMCHTLPFSRSPRARSPAGFGSHHAHLMRTVVRRSDILGTAYPNRELCIDHLREPPRITNSVDQIRRGAAASSDRRRRGGRGPVLSGLVAGRGAHRQQQEQAHEQDERDPGARRPYTAARSRCARAGSAMPNSETRAFPTSSTTPRPCWTSSNGYPDRQFRAQPP